jgi:hypothetical protein
MATVTWSTKLQAREISLILSQQQLREKLSHACCSYQQSGCMLPPGHRSDQTCHHTIAVRAACWLQATLHTCPLTAASCAPPGYKSCSVAEAAASHSCAAVRIITMYQAHKTKPSTQNTSTNAVTQTSLQIICPGLGHSVTSCSNTKPFCLPSQLAHYHII